MQPSTMPFTGPLLVSDQVDRHRPFGAFGRPAYLTHIQLKAMLASRLGAKYANYFARPTHDANSASLSWNAEVVGDVRRFEQLPPEDQSRLAREQHTISDGLQRLAKDLRASGGTVEGGATAFAGLLEQAVRVPPDGNFLYFVGDQPVVAFWGFESVRGESVIPRAMPTQYAPVSPPPPLVPPAPVAPMARPKDDRPIEVPKLRSVLQAPRKRSWWWLLWLLLGILLLLLLFSQMRGCAQDDRPISEGANRHPLEQVDPVRSPAPLEQPGARDLQSGPSISIPGDALGRGDLSFLEGSWQVGEGLLTVTDRSGPIGKDRDILRFGPKGEGIGQSIERTRQGKPVPPCSGAVHARTDGSKLYIDREPCLVAGGESSPTPNLECERREVGTRCFWVNVDGRRVTDVPLRRLEQEQ